MGSELLERIIRYAKSIAAIFATAVVIVGIAVFANTRSRVTSVPMKITTQEFNWKHTSFIDTVQGFTGTVDPDVTNYEDAGFISGKSSFFLGQLINTDAVNVLAEDTNWLHVEVLSRSIEMEVFRDADSQYFIQSMRCCNGMVQTTRGVHVGMLIEDVLRVYPKGTAISSENNVIKIQADDCVLEFKVDKNDKVSEIFMYFS